MLLYVGFGVEVGLGLAPHLVPGRVEVEPVLEDVEYEGEVILGDGEQRPKAIKDDELSGDDDGEGEAPLPDARIQDLGLVGRLVRLRSREDVG